jgi:hypothetical protein
MRAVLVVVLAVMLPNLASAWTITPAVSLAKAVGDGSDDVRLGISSGGSVLVSATPHWSLGLRAAFTYFPVRGDLPDLTYSGSTEVVEIVPTVRLSSTPSTGSSVTYFGQLGVGVYLIDATLRASSTDPSVPERYEATAEENRAGVSLGAGVVFGEGGTRLEIVPSYQLVFTEGATTQYVLVTLGVAFVR